MIALVGMWKDRDDLPDATTYVHRLRRGKRLKENRILKSVLIDSEILIEVSRARDSGILAKWDA